MFKYFQKCLKPRETLVFIVFFEYFCKVKINLF